MPWGFIAGVSMESPPAIAIRRVKLWLVARLRSTGSQFYSVVENGNATSANVVDLFGAPGGSTLTTPYVSPLLPSDTRIYLVLVGCSGGTGEPCTATDTNILDVRGAEVTLEEGSAPTGSIDGGELMADGPQSGVRALAYTAGDLESGVARVSAIIGKTVVGTADFVGDCAYAALAACPQARNGSISVDTRKVADGIYPVSLRVTDAAGNEKTVQAATAIRVANGTVGGSGSLSGATVPGSARLTASFVANRRATLTAGYRQRVVIRGRIVGSAGEPLAGVAIDSEERPSAGTTRRSVVTTAQDGTFSYIVRRGPSRRMTFSYQGASAAVQLTLRVKAAASLSVALNGTLVKYRGRVLSRPLPRRGKLVEIQGRAPGAAWKTFAHRRVGRRGTFSGTYRLRVHRPGVRLQFRVRVPSERGYPFVGHAGRTLTRTVH
jgi:hypothetical protein